MVRPNWADHAGVRLPYWRQLRLPYWRQLKPQTAGARLPVQTNPAREGYYKTGGKQAGHELMVHSTDDTALAGC